MPIHHLSLLVHHQLILIKKNYLDNVWNKLCNFKFKTYIKQGKNKIGIILNTDPHYLDGSHWICLFIDIKNNYIYYFDSNADSTPKQVTKFINNIKDQANQLGIHLKEYRNKTKHQKTDSECGMYVLYVITELLKENKTPKTFDKRIPDKEMINLRKYFLIKL